MMERRRQEMDTLTNLPDVRSYLMLATRIRKKELTLTPEQEPQFQKMAIAVGPALKAISKISLNLKQMETAKESALSLVAEVLAQKSATAAGASVSITQVAGDVVVATMKFHPDGRSTYDLPAKDIKARVRNSGNAGDRIFAGSRGSVAWNFGQ